MTQNRKIKYGLLIAVWLLLWGGLISPVWAYTQVAPPPAWQTKPVMSNELYPEYHIQSTSTYTPVVGKTTYTTTETYNPFQASSPKRIRRAYNSWEEEPSGEEIGVMPGPIGSPLVLLVLAMIYILKKNIVLISKRTNFKKILKK